MTTISRQTKAITYAASLIYIGRMIEASYSGPTERDKLGTFKNSGILEMSPDVNPYDIQDIYEEKARELAKLFLAEPDAFVVSYDNGFIRHNGVKYVYALRVLVDNKEELFPIKRSLYDVITEVFPSNIKRKLIRQKKDEGGYTNINHYWVE